MLNVFQFIDGVVISTLSWKSKQRVNYACLGEKRINELARIVRRIVIKSHCFCSMKINKTMTSVWHLNIDGYRKLTGILSKVKRFNVLLGISKKKTLSCIYSKNMGSILFLDVGRLYFNNAIILQCILGTV